MNTQAEAPTAVFDTVKQVLSAIMLIAGLAGFYYFSDIPQIYRVLGLVIIIVVVLLVMFTTALGRNIWSFILESNIEVKRVVWPNRDETTRTTLLVFAMVFVVGLILWVLDMFLFWGIRLLTGQGG